jgi:non-ribosomal peptide synthetase component F
VTLPPDVVDGLTRLARARRATPFAALMAAFYGVLRDATGQDDLTVAALYANRARPEVSETVGFLANLLPLRVRLPAGATFDDAVDAVKASTLAAFVHQDLPYQVYRLDRQPGADDVVVNAHARHPGDDPAVRFAGAAAEWLPPDPLGSRFDVELRLVPRADGVDATVFYNRARVAPAFATGLVAAYGEACAAAVSR